MMLALFLAIALQDPVEDLETSAEKHLKDAEAADSADLIDKALYHFDRVIDGCPKATDEQLAAARAGRKALIEKAPANAEEKKAPRWRVLAVICRNYNVRSGDVAAVYRVADAAVKSIREGIAAFEKSVWESSRGALKADVTVMAVDEPVRSLRGEDNGSWMDPGEFERNFPKIKPRDGEFDQVFVYLVGDAKQSITWVEPARWGGRWHYARYWNLMLSGEEKGDGALESRCFLRSLRGVMERCAGYAPRLVPDVDRDPQDDCCRGKQAMEWYRHVMREHVTPRMYAEAPIAAPTAPYLTQRVLVSERFPNEGDKGLETPHLNESNAEMDLKTWTQLKSPDDLMNLNLHFSPRNSDVRATCYLGTYVTVKKGTWARLMFGSTDFLKLFVNGVEAARRTEREDNAEPDEWAFRFTLKEGRNFVLLKTSSGGNPWQIIARLTDAKGGPLKADIFPVRK